MEKQAICVDKLVYRYQRQDENEQHVVFNGLDLSIAEGSFVAVLGHNGCGKSTLAKHMNAILLPQGGSVTVYGMDTRDEALLLEIRRSVGMVFQNPDNQIVANVVEEDVAFGPENLGVPPEEIRRLAALQKTILENASRAVKPGGRLVYSTCSIDAEEDGLLVRDFLQNHPEWTLKEEKLILPHEEKSDGAYAALLICA